MELSEKIQICKVVAHAILADAKITDSEREFIDKLISKYGLTDEQKADALRRNIDDDPAELVASVESLSSKNEIVVELAMAVAVDGEISPAERDVLLKIGDVLDMTEAELDMILQSAVS